MTEEEFEAVLKLIHSDLTWNYGTSTKVAGIVLRNGTANPVKMLAFATPAKGALEALIEKFEKEGVKL